MPWVPCLACAAPHSLGCKQKLIINSSSRASTSQRATAIACRLTLDKGDIEAGKGFSQEDVLLMAALSARWENNDAIDRAITDAVGEHGKLSGYEIQKTSPFNPVDKRTTAWVVSETHGEFVATKGAPQVGQVWLLIFPGKGC